MQARSCVCLGICLHSGNRPVTEGLLISNLSFVEQVPTSANAPGSVAIHVRDCFFLGVYFRGNYAVLHCPYHTCLTGLWLLSNILCLSQQNSLHHTLLSSTRLAHVWPFASPHPRQAGGDSDYTISQRAFLFRIFTSPLGNRDT